MFNTFSRWFRAFSRCPWIEVVGMIVDSLLSGEYETFRSERDNKKICIHVQGFAIQPVITKDGDITRVTIAPMNASAIRPFVINDNPDIRHPDRDRLFEEIKRISMISAI